MKVRTLSLIMVFFLFIGVVVNVWAHGETPDKLVFINIPAGTTTDNVDKFQPTIDWVEEQVGIPIEVIEATDYAVAVEALHYKHADFARLGAMSLINANDLYGIYPIARDIKSNTGEPFYHSVLITRADSGIECPCDICCNAADLTIAFVDPESASGFLFPNLMLAQLGIDTANLKEYVFAGSHASAIISVAKGFTDLAGTNEYRLGKGYESGDVEEDEIRILLTSGPIPTSPICVRPGLDEELVAKLQAAFLSVPYDTARIFALDGFAAATVEDYRMFEELLERFEI